MSKAPRDIDVALLRAFLAVVDTGGMTSAGRVLNLTQAAVSQQIKRLEALLDCELIDRSKRQLVLTASGERVLSYARRMLTLNDELWSMMTAPAFEGEVTLGVPHDIIGVFMPQILRGFGQAWPRVSVTLVSKTTPRLIELLKDGGVDLILTTEAERCEETLLADSLVWAGMRGGDAFRQRPLPVALGDATCAFRATAVEALSGANLDWKLMCQTEGLEPVIAILEADMAVAPFLAKTVPERLEIVPAGSGLPPLPTYYVNMRLPAVGGSEITAELARHIRNGFSSRFAKAA